jgi:hypothetical protein
MYNKGLERFLQAKKVSSQKAINAFLQSKEITDFTAKNHFKVNGYINANFEAFATFVDQSIKNGTLTGKAVKLNTSWEIQRQRSAAIGAEFHDCNADEIALYNDICKYDDCIHLSKTQSFFNKRGVLLPGNNHEAISRIGKLLPKLQFIINHSLFEEYKAFLG